MLDDLDGIAVRIGNPCNPMTSGVRKGITPEEPSAGYSRVTRYAACMIPWLVFALVAIPLLLVGFVATRRRTAAGEHPTSEDAQAEALTEQEFAEAEAYEAKWREEDKDRYHEERLP
jgi:hypothetical protein